MNRSALRRNAPVPRAKALSPRSPRDHAARLIDRLEGLYPASEYALLRDVRSSTGCPEVLSYADALAVNLLGNDWEIHGFEVKRCRADWLAELRNPLKSAPLKLFCASWWLVVPAPAKAILLSLNELPDLWGALEVGTGAPRVLRYAVERRAESPEHHPGFMKSLLRSAARARAERDELADEGRAPMVRITRIVDRNHVALACAHIVLRPLTKVFPIFVPCHSCAEGRPIDHEYLEAAFFTLPEEDKARLRTLINGRKPGGAA